MTLKTFKLRLILWIIPLCLLTSCFRDREFEHNKRSFFELEVIDTNNNGIEDIAIKNNVNNGFNIALSIELLDDFEFVRSTFSDNQIIGEATTNTNGKASMAAVFADFDDNYDNNIILVNGFTPDPDLFNSPLPIDEFLSTPVIFNGDEITTSKAISLPPIRLEPAGFFTIQLNDINNTDTQVIVEASFNPATKYLLAKDGALSEIEFITSRNNTKLFVNQNPNGSTVIRTIIPSTVTMKITERINGVATEEIIEVPITQQEQTFTYDY